jgi:hypothetical protein
LNAGSFLVQALVNDSNYIGQASATLVINPATATVTADLKWIYDYDPLPSFTATFSGFLGSDDESDVDSLSFSVSPTYTGAAGTYQIIPYAAAANYIFTAINGPLYVNPNGSGTQQIKPKLKCVEKLSAPDSSGFWYIANFEYENSNAMDVYIPIGADNYFSGSAAYNGVNRPQLFKSGGGAFTVPFDGNMLVWTVISYKSNGQKGTYIARANSSSNACVKSEEAEAPVMPVEEINDLKAYPNPTSGKVYIDLGGNTVTAKDILVNDIYGRAYRADLTGLPSDRLELDLSGYKAGIYIVRINTGKSVETIQIIKK